jgi:hypothetical protein
VTLRYSGGDYHLYGQADPSVPVMPTGGSWFFGKGLKPEESDADEFIAKD